MKNIRHLLLASTVLATLSGCGGAKTSDSVFPVSSSACGQEASEKRFIVEWEDGRFTVENGNSSEDFRKTFVSQNLEMIKHVDQDVRVQLKNQNDIISAEGGEMSAESLNWGAQRINAPQVWSQGYDGDGVVVGVIDGMVDVNHPQLSSNIAVNDSEIPGNNVDDDGNGFVDDYKGIQVNKETNNPSLNRHGTHVSGIIVADQSTGPIAGVAQRAKVLPAQFIGNDGGGSIGDAIVALNYVANRGVKIINMSWGLDSCIEVPSLYSTLAQLSNKGILLVTAAGNGDSRGVGVNMDKLPAYPSAYNFASQINVAASTMSDFLIGFSNYGVRTVHVAAPGVGIYSTTPNNQVETMSGTSMAAPMVSGAAALLWNAEPTANASQIKQAILQSVDKNPSIQLDVSSGGVINVEAALTKLRNLLGH